jgi:hypothetical protein
MDGSGKVNILLVDDQPAKLLTYEVVLDQLGENLIKATTAREALDCRIRATARPRSSSYRRCI